MDVKGSKSASDLRGQFLKVRCPRCNKHNTIFGKSATLIKCKKCNRLLLKTTGGKSKLRAPVFGGP